MDGLFNLCGDREQVFEHEGKTYTFSVRYLRDFAAFESFMLSRTVSPYKGIEVLPPQLQQIAVAAAAQESAKPKIVTIEQSLQFAQTWPGLGYRIWQSLQKHHATEFPPNASPEEGAQLGMNFLEWVGHAKSKALVSIIDKVDEEDILGNLDGQQTTAAV